MEMYYTILVLSCNAIHGIIVNGANTLRSNNTATADLPRLR